MTTRAAKRRRATAAVCSGHSADTTVSAHATVGAPDSRGCTDSASAIGGLGLPATAARIRGATTAARGAAASGTNASGAADSSRGA
jgi:hypothetical protein